MQAFIFIQRVLSLTSPGSRNHYPLTATSVCHLYQTDTCYAVVLSALAIDIWQNRSEVETFSSSQLAVGEIPLGAPDAVRIATIQGKQCLQPTRHARVRPARRRGRCNGTHVVVCALLISTPGSRNRDIRQFAPCRGRARLSLPTWRVQEHTLLDAYPIESRRVRCHGDNL